MKRTTMMLLLCLLLTACSKPPILEGNTAGPGSHYVHWIRTGETPRTCFISEGGTIEEQSPAGTSASFRFGATRFRADGRNLVISAVTGAHLETIPMDDSIFLLSKGGYTKVKQSQTIRNLMERDHENMGDALIGHLKAAGKL